MREIERVEGYLNVDVIIKGDDIRVHAEALEGTRIVERVFIGRHYWEAIEIASRMCGVCHVIHKLTATQAVESAFGVELPRDAMYLRDLLAIAGHIQSHLTHLYYFVLPDYYDRRNFLEILPLNRDLLLDAMKLRQMTVHIVRRIGGSQVHPITPVVGGFSKALKVTDIERIRDLFIDMKKLAPRIASGILEVNYPEFSNETNYVSLTNKSNIPLLRGDISINGENTVSAEKYLSTLKLIREDYSNAPHYLLNNEPFFVGALARLNINHKYLSEEAKDLCKRNNIAFPNNNPFLNNQAQAIEIIHFIDEALRILDELRGKKELQFRSRYKVKSGLGISVTEAPRGTLIHQYKLNDEGIIEEANIITPTAQNLKNLEKACEKYVRENINTMKIEILKKELLKLIRSYDPCISCAARFRKESE